MPTEMLTSRGSPLDGLIHLIIRQSGWYYRQYRGDTALGFTTSQWIEDSVRMPVGENSSNIGFSIAQEVIPMRCYQQLRYEEELSAAPSYHKQAGTSEHTCVFNIPGLTRRQLYQARVFTPPAACMMQVSFEAESDNASSPVASKPDHAP
jgi:hypothetical protein